MLTATLLSASIVAPSTGTAGGAPSLTISGTTEYTGSQGTVSASNPIILIASRDSTFDGLPADLGSVETNGGAFELTMPEAGDYYLACVFDANGDSLASPGDPVEIYENRLAAPGDPIAVPGELQSGLELVFDDAGGLPGVFGTVTYTGSMGPVDETRPIRVHIFREGDLSDRVDRQIRVADNGGSYEMVLFENRLHYMEVFLDLNDDDVLDPGEPYEIYPDRLVPPGDALPEGVAEVDIVFGDTLEPTPTPSEGFVLSGTIEYTGSQGPVSASRPILMFLSTSPGLIDGPPVSGAFIDTNGGAFQLFAPTAGDYYLGYLLDSNGDAMPAPGDPFEVYLDRPLPPGDAVAVPQSGLELSFDDSNSLPGISGTVTYTGTLGTVTPSTPLVVDIYRDAALTDRLDMQALIAENGGAFGTILFEDQPHYLMAFLDLNRNDVRDDGEPYIIYDNRTATPGDPIPDDGSVLDIQFADQGVDLPTPTATFTATPTESAATTATATSTATSTATPEGPMCVGDCNGDGMVSISELITGVNISLGTFGVDRCPAFDPNQSGTVTINELVQAVNNSLDGCPS